MSLSKGFTRHLIMPVAYALMLMAVFPTSVLAVFEIYVSDAGNFQNPPWKILKTDEDGSNPEVFITQNLAWPQDILFLEDDNTVLISNLNSGRITRYNADTGAYIDNFALGIAGPTRMKIGPDNLLYVLQWNGNNRVRRYQLNGTLVDEFTSVGVSQSIGLDWDSDGNLYVSSFNGGSVRKFNTNGADMGLFVNTNLGGPTNIWFDVNGDLLVSDYSSGGIKRFDANGNFLNVFISGVSRSEGVAYFPNGNILIGNGASSSVKMFDSNGSYIEDIIPPQPGGLQTPNAVVLRQVLEGESFTINAGLNDAWFDLDTPGQGFFISVFQDMGVVFMAWFTFDTVLPDESVEANLGWAGQRWVTAFGAFTGDTAVLDVEVTSGGIFDSIVPVPSQQGGAGTITLKFTDCEHGTVSYNIPSIGRMGVIAISRLAPDNVALCIALNNG